MGTKPDWDVLAESLAADALAQGRPTEWFDPLYAAGVAGTVSMPWSRQGPHPLVAGLLDGRRGDGQRAIVVGCGLGADAEYLAGAGYDTVGFDVSPTAIEQARLRQRSSGVEYRTADLFALPPEWLGAFDLVVEVYTVQALPVRLRRQAVRAIASLAADDGTLLVVQRIRSDDDSDRSGPPWPLTRAEIELFSGEGLTVRHLADVDGHWCGQFGRR